MVAEVSIEDIAARVKELIAEIAGDMPADDIPDDLPLFDAEHAVDGLELDSLDSLKLAVTLANEYDLDEAAEMDYSRVTTVREIAEYVHGLIAPGGER